MERWWASPGSDKIARPSKMAGDKASCWSTRPRGACRAPKGRTYTVRIKAREPGWSIVSSRQRGWFDTSTVQLHCREYASSPVDHPLELGHSYRNSPSSRHHTIKHPCSGISNSTLSRLKFAPSQPSASGRFHLSSRSELGLGLSARPIPAPQMAHPSTPR